MSNVTKPVMLDDTGKSVAQALGNVATAINNMDKVQWGQVKGTLSNQTDLKNNLNSLQSQIDSFTALTDGSTTGDAELTNIRVDSAGHTYSTAGDAVRAIDAQVRDMKTGFDGVVYPSPAAMVTGEDEKLFDMVTDYGEKDYKNLSDISGNLMVIFESGYVESTQNGFVYSNNANRVRTPQGKTITLSVGDTIGLTSYDGVRYRAGYYNTDTGTYGDYGWRTSDLTIVYPGNYVIMIGYTEDAPIPFPSNVGKLFKCHIKSNALSNQEDVNKSVTADQKHQNIQIDRNNKINTIILPQFEIGYVTSNSSGFVYSNNSQVVRTKQGVAIHLYAGDVVGLSDFTLFRLKSSRYDTTTSTYKNIDWRTTNLTVSPDMEGDYVFMLGYQDGRTISDASVIEETFHIWRNNDPLRLRVTTFNIGHFAYGGGTSHSGIYDRYGIPTAVYEDRLKNWKNFFSDTHSDLVFIQEYSRCLDRVTGASDSTGLVKTVDTIFNYLYPYNIIRNNPSGQFVDNALFSVHQLIDWKQVNFGSAGTGSSTWGNFARIYVHGREIVLLNVHLWSGENETTKRAEEISDIIDFIENEKYVILCGDMNIWSVSELTPFINAGYNIANTGGYFGNVPTFNTNIEYLSNQDETAGQSWNDTDAAAGTNLYLDNVITTPNIKIQSFTPLYDWYEKLTSDHVAVVSEIVIL